MLWMCKTVVQYFEVLHEDMVLISHFQLKGRFKSLICLLLVNSIYIFFLCVGLTGNWLSLNQSLQLTDTWRGINHRHSFPQNQYTVQEKRCVAHTGYMQGTVGLTLATCRGPQGSHWLHVGDRRAHAKMTFLVENPSILAQIMTDILEGDYKLSS